MERLQHLQLQKELTSVEAQFNAEKALDDKILMAKKLVQRYQKNLSSLSYLQKQIILQKLVARVVIKGRKATLELKIPKHAHERINKSKGKYGGDGGNRTRVQKGNLMPSTYIV